MSSSQLTSAAVTSQPPVPYAAETISLARTARSFPTREVLTRIVTAEQQRLKQEQMLWRVAGAFLGACLGQSDGFDAGDIFLGMGLSGLAGMGHEVMSHEQRQFLEQCRSLWTIGANSPTDLAARLGPARARILVYNQGWDCPVILSHHQGSRGDALVQLGAAHQFARGFRDHQSLEVMQRHFNTQELQVLQQQLYPDASAADYIRRIHPLTAAQALELDPSAKAFLPHTEPVLIESNAGRGLGYRLPIPVHSDF